MKEIKIKIFLTCFICRIFLEEYKVFFFFFFKEDSHTSMHISDSASSYISHLQRSGDFLFPDILLLFLSKSTISWFCLKTAHIPRVNTSYFHFSRRNEYLYILSFVCSTMHESPHLNPQFAKLNQREHLDNFAYYQIYCKNKMLVLKYFFS